MSSSHLNSFRHLNINLLPPHHSGEEVPANTPSTQPETSRRGRGPAKLTEFEKLRKHGRVLLKINPGETAPYCENASMFTARITWIVKQHCDMSYPRWNDVPQPMKDQLIDRIRVRLLLKWQYY